MLVCGPHRGLIVEVGRDVATGQMGTQGCKEVPGTVWAGRVGIRDDPRPTVTANR